MLSGIVKAVGYLWGGEEEDGDPEDRAAQSHDSPTHKTFTGQVTSIHNGFGLVNNEAYFSLECVVGQVVPEVGSKVRVTARRKSDTDGWRVMSVSLCLDEDQDDTSDEQNKQVSPEGEAIHGTEETDSTETKTEILVANITAISRDYGLLNGSIPFDMAICEGYEPAKGDWVTAEITTIDTGESKATSIKPLRQKDFEGEINTALQGFGYIDADIYFTFCVCEEDWIPRRGDKVSGRAVESNRGKSTWRAIRVRPINRELEKQHKMANR